MRSQLFITDLIFTVSIFLVLFAFIAYNLNTTVNEEPEKLRRVQAELIADELASLLVLTPGYPVDWDSATIVYPGAAYQENELDWTKLNGLMAMDDLNSSDKLYLPFTISVVIENSTYVNCSNHLKLKYGGCSFTDEPRAARLLMANGEVYRLWVVVE